MRHLLSSCLQGLRCRPCAVLVLNAKQTRTDAALGQRSNTLPHQLVAALLDTLSEHAGILQTCKHTGTTASGCIGLCPALSSLTHAGANARQVRSPGCLSLVASEAFEHRNFSALASTWCPFTGGFLETLMVRTRHAYMADCCRMKQRA